ncbi:hypothetical protein KJE20_14064 [Pyrenophora tritici-repentis]|nr:hypothetical protein KJE20_14064 [Pyrenophora tritici-repentis]
MDVRFSRGYSHLQQPYRIQLEGSAADDDIVLAGGTETKIEAWGEVKLPLSTLSGIKRVALIQSFFTSLVSLL